MTDPTLGERVSKLRHYFAIRLNSHTPEESEVWLTDLDDILELVEELAKTLEEKRCP